MDRPATLRDELATTAAWMWDFLAPSYGPGGGLKLIETDDPMTLRSGASALRELRLGPVARPWRRLVEDVQVAVGDQGTLAGLLASALVKRGLELPVGALAGLPLARRQALAGLVGQAADPLAVLAAVAPGRDDLAASILGGLADVPDLDDIDLRPEPGPPKWLAGAVAEPQQIRYGQGRVVLVEAWRRNTRTDARVTLRAPSSHADDIGPMATRLRGVALLVCAGELPEDLSGRVQAAVWTDAPRDAMARLASTTGTSILSDLAHIDADHMGTCTVERRPRRDGVLVRGPGPSWTLTIPGQPALARDDGERMLRAAAASLQDPRGLPGGGAWQRRTASSLRRAAPAAPGKASLAVEAAAKAFDDVADALIRNTGRDPTREATIPTDVMDSRTCVRTAVAAAFDAAIMLLRIDQRIAKAPSTPERLRGQGTPKSLRQMAGDVPALM